MQAAYKRRIQKEIQQSPYAIEYIEDDSKLKITLKDYCEIILLIQNYPCEAPQLITSYEALLGYVPECAVQWTPLNRLSEFISDVVSFIDSQVNLNYIKDIDLEYVKNLYMLNLKYRKFRK
jgi:hypothetical protein